MPIKQKVKRGDCIASIAYEHGLLTDAIWEDPRNAGLKRKRTNPNMLVAGDEVIIPEKRLREENAQSAQRHRFRRKEVPESFRLQLLCNEIPRKTVNYIINIEGEFIQGTTDDQGWLEHFIPPNAKKGSLHVEGDEEKIELLFGSLPPVDEEEGVNMRLINLGYLDEGDLDNKEAQEVALAEFQEHCGLKITGQIDEKTRKKLTELHQS